MTMMKLVRGAAIPGRLGAAARRFAADSTGVTAVEYAVMTFIAIAIVLAITQLGDSVGAMYERVQATFVN
jgi:Flp pilus assembly pilin Flp